MLLLVTIVLVLIAAITLLIGIFGDNLTLIFVSIGSSALAAIVLAVLSQASRRKARDEAMATAAPAAEDVTPVPTTVSAVTTAPAATTTAAAGATAATTAVLDLPIADYDSLRVNEVLPNLEGLDLDQLEAVAQHEESTKNRSSILDRIDELMDELEAAESAPPAASVAAANEQLVEDIEAGDVVPEAKVSGGFPIDDYESLSVNEIVAALEDLDADQLEEVAEYEETHANRDRVLDAIDDRLDILEGVVAAPKKAAKKAATKKAAAKSTKKAPAGTAKKAVAKAGAPVKKAASPTKKVAATKATTKKAAAKKASTPAVKKAATGTKKTAAKAAKKATKKAKKA